MCTSPNYMVWNGKTYLQTFKKKIAIKDNPLTLLPSDYETHINYGNERPLLEFVGKKDYKTMLNSGVPWIQVPCGQCLECRIQQVRSWADRIILESKRYKDNYFITLTYDDNHIPFNGSLVKDDITKFIHKLRDIFRNRYYFQGVRFFACGEYGDTTRRCHYHLVLFNCPLPDLVPDFLEAYNHKYDSKGKLIDVKFHSHYMPNRKDMLLYSPTIHEAWNYKGNISVGKVTYDSASYVAGYVVKKYKPGMKDYYDSLNISPEFVKMSTHPGIGFDYYQEHDELNDDKLIIPSKGGAHLSQVPRYFEKLFIKKYGEDVFNTKIRYDRIKNRFNKRNSNIHFGVDEDYHSWNRDNRLKKKQKLRDAI